LSEARNKKYADDLTPVGESFHKSMFIDHFEVLLTIF
jgi:hypothetical protein